MASRAPVVQTTAIPGTTCRAETRTSSPAKRWAPTVVNEQEKELTETLEDYATRIGQHHQALKINASAFKTIEAGLHEVRYQVVDFV